jgi:hypothetical protein
MNYPLPVEFWRIKPKVVVRMVTQFLKNLPVMCTFSTGETREITDADLAKNVVGVSRSYLYRLRATVQRAGGLSDLWICCDHDRSSPPKKQREGRHYLILRRHSSHGRLVYLVVVTGKSSSTSLHELLRPHYASNSERGKTAIRSSIALACQQHFIPYREALYQLLIQVRLLCLPFLPTTFSLIPVSREAVSRIRPDQLTALLEIKFITSHYFGFSSVAYQYEQFDRRFAKLFKMFQQNVNSYDFFLLLWESVQEPYLLAFYDLPRHQHPTTGSL